MENFYIKTRKFDKLGVLIFSLLFITVGFLQSCSLTFGKLIISCVQWPAVALGCLIILERLINFKHYIKTRGIILLVFFALSYVASSFWTMRYGWYENVRFLVFMVFQFGILYATDAEQNPDESKKLLTVCSAYYLVGTSVLSLLSFVFMFAGYSKIFYPDIGAEGPIYYIGFMNGRLFGAYWDPNIAATMAAVAIVISIYFIINSKKIAVRFLCVLSAVLELLYLTFSDSRTGRLCIIAGILFFTLLMAFKHRFFVRKSAQAAAACAVLIVSVAAACFLPTLIKNGYNAYVKYQIRHDNTEINNNSEADNDKTDEDSATGESSDGSAAQPPEIPEDVFDRGYDMSEDISNRRFDIWKSAVEIWKSSPVFGISRANVLPYVDDNLPDSYLINNDHMRFDSMHNMYFEILACQGAVGIILFIAFIVYVIAGIFKYGKYLWKHEDFPLFALIIGIAAAVCMSTLVMAEIVYVVSPISTLFWLAIGCLNHYSSHSRLTKEEK